MQVYLIRQNYEEFVYLLQETEADYIDTLDKEGKEFKKWKTPTWKIFEKGKKKLKLRKDFNTTCWFSSILIMEKSLAEKYFPNEFCNTTPIFPKELNSIVPAKKGILFRDWNNLFDIYNGKPPIMNGNKL